jgi:hypothetical protein
VTGTEKVLSIAGIAAAIAWAASRTQKGQEVTADAVAGVIAAGGAVADALLPRGIRNNNPGNIEYIAVPSKAWRGQVGKDGRFGIYDKPENGVRAIGKELLLDYSRGIRTVRGAISNWAPPHENNTAAYVNAVAEAIDVAPDQQINIPAVLGRMVAAIIQHENGMQPYSQAELELWARAA